MSQPRAPAKPLTRVGGIEQAVQSLDLLGNRGDRVSAYDIAEPAGQMIATFSSACCDHARPDRPATGEIAP